MPQMGVSVSEGTITKWLKQEGEEIEADEPLLEISTDKVDTEVPSPGSGVVAQIIVQEGETVAVGTTLAVIGDSAGAAAAPAPPNEQEPEAAPAGDGAPGPQVAPQAAADAAMAAASEGAGSIADAPPAQAPPAQAEPAPPAEPSGNGRTFVSPVVARIAADHGVDPAQVPGTGRGGRVTKKDILAFVESGPAVAAAPAEATAPAAPAAPSAPPPPAPVAAQAPPARPPAAAPPAPPAAPPAAEPGAAPGETSEPVTAMRRGIAEHMRRSLDTAAHVTSAIEVDMSK